MKHGEIINKIEENPIIAAVREECDLDEAIASQVTTIFLLHADIFNLNGMVERVKNAGKIVLIHIDLLEGLGRDNKTIDYICKVVGPHGIISTKSSSIKYAMEKGLFTIQRFFLIDSLSYDNSIKTIQTVKPHMIEIMPGVMPALIKKILNRVSIPLIAGGLIETKEDILEILNAGALGVSSGKKQLWSI